MELLWPFLAPTEDGGTGHILGNNRSVLRDETVEQDGDISHPNRPQTWNADMIGEHLITLWPLPPSTPSIILRDSSQGI
jgi:hypothetical protein